MKLKELLSIIQDVATEIGASTPMLCGGAPRDRYMGRLDNIADLDITNGDGTIDYLSQQLYLELRKQYNVTRTTSPDGHSSIFLGSFKLDFSSNFNIPNIDKLLQEKNIANPSNLQREVFSRDFTCNSLLLSFDLKHVVDLTHQGLKDIDNKIIKTCLSPEITLTSNRNRVARCIYLAAKLDFNVDPQIIEFVKKNPESIKISTNKVLVEKLSQAFQKDPDKSSYLITQMGLWNYIPISEEIYPYYKKNTKQSLAYFQGGGGVNEPAPKKHKYKIEPAITVQPRFKEPFYRSYDLYDTPGVSGSPKHGPGAGWNQMHKFKGIKDFLSHQRKRLKDKYKADDSYITENNFKERQDQMKIRANILSLLIKNANDISHLDFPSDDDVTFIIGDSESYLKPTELGPLDNDLSAFPNQVNLGTYESYPSSAQIGGMTDRYLANPDLDDKPESTLNHGADLIDNQPETAKNITPQDLKYLFEKYPFIPDHGLMGLPDGVDLPQEDEPLPFTLNPYYDSFGPDSTIYEDKWNI